MLRLFGNTKKNKNNEERVSLLSADENNIIEVLASTNESNNNNNNSIVINLKTDKNEIIENELVSKVVNNNNDSSIPLQKSGKEVIHDDQNDLISLLPNEIKIEIVPHLNVPELAALRATCRNGLDLVESLQFKIPDLTPVRGFRLSYMDSHASIGNPFC